MVFEQDKIDSILDGLFEEYNLFVIQIYGVPELQSLYDAEAFLYVQEAQLDKFRQELVVWSVSLNVAHANNQTIGVHDNFFYK